MKSTFTNTTQDKDFMQTVMRTIGVKAQVEEKKQINEKLEDHEADEVNYGWDTERPSHVEDAIHNVFGNKDRIEIPFNRHTTSPHPEVEAHLNQHGYKITDYLNGKATDKYNREVNIGKALSKTGAPENIKSTFENDPERAQKSKTNMKIVISHRPTDVAGMTSCGHSWEDSSCMNFKTGSNRGYLPHDVIRGTHVAYLTTDDDKDLDKPISRIAVKPFHSENEEHTIFRPETSTYGETPHGFHSTVSDWFEKHYPAHEGETYAKDPHVYNDDNKTHYTEYSHDDIDRMLKANTKFTGRVSHKNVSYIANKLVNDAKEGGDLMVNFARHAHSIDFDRNQANDIYKAATAHEKNKNMLNHIAGKYGSELNGENLNHILSTYSDPKDMHTSVVGHKYLPKEIVDTIPTNMIGDLHKSNITPQHVQRAVESYKNEESGSSYVLNDIYDRLQKEHLKDLISHEISRNEPSKMGTWLSYDKADDEVFDHAFNEIKKSKTENPNMMTYFNRNNKKPTSEHVAHTNSISGLNGIMRNANDKLTHNLAFYKAVGLKNQPNLTGTRAGIILGENSDKYIGDDELEHMYQNHTNFSHGGLGSMSNKIHSAYLDKHMEHINKMAEEHENSDDEDRKAELEGKIDEGLEKHAELIDDRIDNHVLEFRNGNPVDEKNLHHLRKHIDAGLEHPYHYHTHDDVDSNHNDLLKEIEGRY